MCSRCLELLSAGAANYRHHLPYHQQKLNIWLQLVQPRKPSGFANYLSSWVINKLNPPPCLEIIKEPFLSPKSLVITHEKNTFTFDITSFISQSRMGLVFESMVWSGLLPPRGLDHDCDRSSQFQKLPKTEPDHDRLVFCSFFAVTRPVLTSLLGFRWL